MKTMHGIRNSLAALYEHELFVEDKFGGKVVELIGTSFKADGSSIFGEVNYDYVKRELEWYNSQSLNVNDIPGETPAIWKKVAFIQKKMEINLKMLFKN